MGWDDGIDDLFERRGGGGLARVGVGGHSNLEYNVEMLAGIVVVGGAAIIEVAGLDFDVILVSSTLFFEKGCDDAGGGVDKGG